MNEPATTLPKWKRIKLYKGVNSFQPYSCLSYQDTALPEMQKLTISKDAYMIPW